MEYESNILKRLIDTYGVVQDTLNCLTGEVTERIGEIVLDGSENWVPFNNFSVDGYSSFVATIPTLNNLHNNDVITIINDKFASTSWRGYLGNKESELVWSHDPNKIGIRVKTEKASDVKGFKAFLLANNVRIQYQLTTESIKTVELTVLDQNGQNVKQLMSFNGGTHFNTGSLEGSPLPTVSVSVETDLEETLKVCSLEGNTM